MLQYLCLLPSPVRFARYWREKSRFLIRDITIVRNVFLYGVPLINIFLIALGFVYLIPKHWHFISKHYFFRFALIECFQLRAEQNFTSFAVSFVEHRRNFQGDLQTLSASQ